jgi:aminoglycoside phosphotransferase (APT) family kinase protein
MDAAWSDPRSEADRVRGFACDAVGSSPERVSAVSRFEAGDRHDVFKVSFVDVVADGRDVVVRVSTRRGTEACAEVTREASVIERAAGVAAPKLYDVRCDSRWFDRPAMCMQFVAGQQRDLATAPAETLEQLGSLIAQVHRLSTAGLLDEERTTCTVAAYLHDRHRATVDRVDPLRDLIPAEVRDRVDAAVTSLDERVCSSSTSDSFQTGEQLVLLHGDPGAANVIWTPEPVLIDWEYARLGDPADEIAYLFGQVGLTAAQREAFWHGYRQRAARRWLDDVVDRVCVWEPLTLVGSALWWLEHCARRTQADRAGVDDPTTPRPAGYYLRNADLRLDRLADLEA